MDAQRALDYVASHYNAALSFSGLADALHIAPNRREAN
jgi:YesN/AraC family two-component response regulator